MKALTKTQQRADWARKHREEIEKARTDIIIPSRHHGHNARGIIGMSGGGWGWWANALAAAGIESNYLPYWSGSAPTPSTAINRGIAQYIVKNCPTEIR